MHLTIVPGSTGEFQKSLKILKNLTFLKMRKNSTISKLSIVMCFSSRTAVCNHLNLNSIKTTLKTIFSLNIVFFIFNPKNFKFKKTVQNSVKRLPIKMHTYRQKFTSILLAFGQK